MLWADSWWHVCGRWNDAMESPTLKKEHWRKSGQWFVLNRRHVQIVVNDTEVAQAFKECVRCLLSSCSALQQCSVMWHPCGIARAPILPARLLLDELQPGCKSRQHVCRGHEIVSTALQALLGGLRGYRQWLGPEGVLPG